MKRTYFDEPRPANGAEIAQAMSEVGIPSAEAWASVFDDGETEDGAWWAEIWNAEDPEARCVTLGFPTREALYAALTEARVFQYEECF
ncbi:MAG: hypothetical protein Q4G14_14485 [Paracoccus sp. (in: a-proteobacteria)]|uniref:hypothetical protein n=1 Tax=Paracoccus sp. TaxID=267 RepID=UPI0026DED5BB|nr:hypothetical protein [Paracoccus sp. (in: a-proteobacteria)]MDO5614435.1 hypothetical protein [Paracoccus sp. (in: a-proteobacteria)]